MKTFKHLLSLNAARLAALLVVIAPAASVKGQVRTPVSIAMVNGGFDAGNFTGWNLSGDNFDTCVDDGYDGWGITPYSGGYCADFGTISPNSFGYLTQTLTVLFVSQSQAAAQGAGYSPANVPPPSDGGSTNCLISFWVNNPFSDPNVLHVSWNGTNVFAATNFPAAAVGWTNIQIFVPLGNSDNPVLQFGFQDDDAAFGLDNISVVLVTNVPPTAPQPYFIAGDINGWNAQGSQMYGSPTICSNVVTGTPGDYEQLKVTDGTWNNTWPGSNLQIDFDPGGRNAIYFIPGTCTDGWYPTANRVGFDNPGNVWEVSGDFTIPNWGDDASAQMTADDSGVLSVSYVIPNPGTYSFKFKIFGTWNGAIGADFGMNAANISVTTGIANEPVLFKLDLPNGRFQTVLPLVTNQVVFAVDMSSQIQIGHFHPGSSVFVSGDFNSWAGTGLGALALTNYPPYNGGGNTNIYYGTNTFVGSPNSTGPAYKFTDNDPAQPAGDNGYEQVNNRSFNLLAASGTLLLPVVYFGDYDGSDYLAQDTAVSFRVDMNNAQGIDGHQFSAALDSIYINGQFANYNSQFGSWYPWSDGQNPASAPAGYQMIEQGVTTIYTNTIIIPAGTPVGFEYKYGMDPNNNNGGPLDDEAGFKANHFRVVRSTALIPYPMPTDTFGNHYGEPLFSGTSAGGGNLNVGPLVAGKVPVVWLGRPGAHLQVRGDLSSGTWQDMFATDGTNWTSGYSSTNGFVSQTNWPAVNASFFRLIKP